MDKCLICGMETANEVENFIVCSVCEGKYGSWDKIKNKLLSLKIPDVLSAEIESLEKSEKKPFECKLEYSGGTKQDIIRVILGLMEQESISFDELEENRW